ncbi:acylamino-acid-releasing enzyme-like [Indicator indicator]|uniref:acylamino-acid-releasing enzyme-like n=1 Tax=Indicator indicator TaxID=1002788 RepID=UPI0023DF5E7C|nr:acylamino-acid-releasing enzyme-like [Indicator indicator]
MGRRQQPSAMEQGPTASGTEWGMQVARGPTSCYRELSRFPTVTRAALGAASGGQSFLLYTECSRPDLSRHRLLRFSRHYSLQRAGSRSIAVSQAALSAEIHNQYGRDRRLLSQDSPTGQHRAVLSRCPWLGHELLEVWGSSGRSHSVDLTALGKHGEVYTEGPFACLSWSHSETQLLYVAEKSRPKPQPPCPWDVPGAARPAEEHKDGQDEQFVYHEGWGEALSTRSMPVVCALDLESSSLLVLEGIPEHLCPGQALWSPDDHGVVFVGWWHKPFRLGLSACSNRSPDGQHLLYLEGDLGGPHRQCLRLRMITWQTRQAVTVLDVVHEPTEAFAGLYVEALPPRCWAADSRRAVLGTPQRSRTDLLLVDTETAIITNLTAGTQAFEALLLSPTDSMVPHPLIVCPHGGPHAVFDARWRPSMAALCRLGFAVLLAPISPVNYRGSLGFGQASISSLLSRVGEQDVADTQLAVEQALSSEPLDPHRLALLAGSHGAFIALHLLTHEPERYRACALRSPVSNLPALLGTSDIPDWRYTSLGLPYSFERVPSAEDVATMLLRSPIAQAARVRTPVLLCVGARDQRVSPTQALELYRVLRARGVPTQLLWYPEGGHALAGVEMEASVFGNCACWFLQHLGQLQQDGTGQHSP